MQWAVVSPSIPLGPHSEEQEGLGQWSLVGGEHLDQEWPVYYLGIWSPPSL